MFLCTACNNEGPTTGKDPSSDNITDAKLPKGRPALEETDRPVLPGENTTPLGDPNAGADPATATPQSREDFLKKQYRNLLVFHADDTMEVNQSRLATLVLAKDNTVEKLKIEVLDESNAKDDNIKTDTTIDLGSRMRARLVAFGESRDQNSFDIEALGDEEQSFHNRKKILWQWKITPRKTGEQELKLSIQVVEKDGEKVTLPAKNIPVVIYAKPENMFDGVADFFSRKWEFLLTAIFIPVIIAYFTTKMRNKAPGGNFPPPSTMPPAFKPEPEKQDKPAKPEEKHNK
jgi:hypothetical protein